MDLVNLRSRSINLTELQAKVKMIYHIFTETPTTEITEKDEVDIHNELKEFVKQRYARRYRSKFPRRKSSNLIDEVILEESETEIAEAEAEESNSKIPGILKVPENSPISSAPCSDSDESQKTNSQSKSETNIAEAKDSEIQKLEKNVLNDANMNMVLKLKRKKGVTFSPEPAKPNLNNISHC
jgi:hypothetical protein